MRVYQKMKPIGVLLYLTGCVRLLKDGDGFSFVFRRWHPVSYILMAVMVLPCAVMGEKLSSVVPLSLSKFWQKNCDQLQWVAPWTDTSTLKPFVYKPSRERLDPDFALERDDNGDWQSQ